MSIKEVCKKYGISPDTLRYYEKAGAIPEVHRTKGGRRDYQEEDLGWVENAICMRSAGLSMEAIAEYVKLYQAGEETIPARLQLLSGQREEIRRQKELIEATLKKLDYKIFCYERAVKTGKLSFECNGEDI